MKCLGRQISSGDHENMILAAFLYSFKIPCVTQAGTQTHATNTLAVVLLSQMWRYEGSRTLAHYLRRRDALRALAADMDVPVEAVPAVVMKQLLQGLTVRCGVQCRLTVRFGVQCWADAVQAGVRFGKLCKADGEVWGAVQADSG